MTSKTGRGATVLASTIPSSFSKRLGAGRIAFGYAGFSILWIIASDAFLKIAVSDPLIQARIEIAKGLSFVLITSLLLYLLLKAWSAPWKDISTSHTESAIRSGSRRLIIAFVLLTIFVPLIGFLVVKMQMPQSEKEAFANLRAIAGLKGKQIENWMEGRRNAGVAMIANDGFIRRVAQLRQHNDPGNRDYVKDRLEAIRQAHGFDDILLLSEKGGFILNLDLGHSHSLNIPASLIDHTFQTGTVQLSSLIADESGNKHWCYLVPLRLQQQEGHRRIGLALLHVNPERFLFPYLQHWPSNETTGETLLVRRDGDSVFFLSKLRHQEDASRNLRLPLSDSNMPAVTAIMANQPGTMHGIDYRGKPVLSAYTPVGGTDWHIVAKLDREEVMEPLHKLGFWISFVAFFATVAISAAMLLLWRQQRSAQQLAIEHKADRLLRHFYDLPFIGMGIASPAMDRWLQCNQQLAEMLGYTADELINIGCADLYHPDDKDLIGQALEQINRNESDSFDANQRFIHKHGQIVFFDMHIRCVRKPNGVIDFLVVTLQDITERMANETRIERLTRLYAASSHCNQAIVRSTRKADLFDEVCRIAVVFGGIKMAWIGLVDDAQAILPVSFYGEGLDYLDNLQISASADNPYGLGPAGQAVRTNRPVWNQNFLNDPLTAPWHELASRYDWRSVAALPLSQNGQVSGVFMLYSQEPDAFDQVVRDLLIEMASDISFGLDNIAREKARHDAEAQLRLAARVFEQSSEGFMITDADNRIVMVNKAFSGITGYSEAEVLGKNPSVLSSGHEKPSLFQSMWSTIEKEGHWQGELLNRKKDGSLYLEWLSISRLSDEYGKLAHYIGIFSDITERKAAEDRVDWLTHFDTLTGLPNRTLLEDRCRHAISTAQREETELALIFLDIDHFKNVNESLGYRTGDDLLFHMGQRLAFALREIDTVARIGGDDFVIVLPDTNADGAALVAEKLLAEVAAIEEIKQHELNISASIGIAIYPDNGHNFDVLSQCAEAAMYRAKNDGRNSFRFFTREMQEHAARTLKLESALRRALEREQMMLHYQPQISLKSGQVIGAEALLRWQHAELGLISPSEFIPIAENNGQILSIGEWVLRTAVRQMKTWLDQGMPIDIMAVNLSAIQFRQPRLPHQVREILEEAGLAPKYLELELTESAAMENPQEAIAVIEELRAHGICVSIDDFGTGHSSLGHLKRFNPHKLKIDRSFVSNIATHPEDRVIVGAIINLADSLGMKTIAEGVETEEQLAYLRSQGCRMVQGYYFSRPLPAKSFEEYVGQGVLSG